MRRTMLVPPVAALLSAVLLPAALLAGCAADAGGTGTGGTGASDAGFAEVLAIPAPTADYAWYPETVTDALPSVRYVDGAGEAHASELTTTGRFMSWEPGEPDHPSLEMIDLTFEVDVVIDSLGDLTMLEGSTVTVHIGIDGSADPDRVAEELLALDDVVLFLNHVGPEPWPPPEWEIVFDNAFLGDVHDDGTVTWPVADAIAANNPADAHPEADVTTLDDLRAATEERTIDVSGG
ncbi:hypothetical protein C8K30_106188 [Promicromonospora sp. AC04]|nr:hypothetical protein C8K30_106188 [Promicromonospora sp. AC04]